MIGAIVIEIFFVLTALASLIASFSKNSYRFSKSLSYLIICTLVTSFTFLCFNFYSMDGGVDGFFEVSRISMASKLLVLVCSTCLFFLVSGALNCGEKFFAKPEFYTLFLLMLTGSFFMLGATDFLSLYLSMELQAIALYVILSLKRKDLKTTESAVKYFLLNATASGIFLYGVTFVYGFSGSTNFSVVFGVLTAANQGWSDFSFHQDASLYVGMLFVLCGLAFKMSLVPFHMWTPDVYQGSPTWVAALLSTISKIVSIAVLISLSMGPFAPLSFIWSKVFLCFGILSIFVGTLSALVQRSLLRLIAFSSIAHMGFIALTFAIANNTGFEQTYAYLLVYAITTLGIFSLLIERSYRLSRNNSNLNMLKDLSGASKHLPGWSFMFAVFLISMAGLPPLAGFFAKFYVLMVLINGGLIVWAVFALLMSVVGAYYYLRLVKIMYFDTEEENSLPLYFSTFDFKTFLFFRGPSFLCLLFVILYAVYPNSLVEFAARLLENTVVP